MRKIYPPNNAICETNEQWRGRNLLHKALLNGEGISREYKGQGPADNRELLSVVSGDRPLYWSLESPEIQGRQFFPLEIAEHDASCVRDFLAVNGIKVTGDLEETSSYIRQEPWKERDLVRVFGNGSHCDPHANDPATLAILPEMKRSIWNLVRFNYEAPEF